MMMLFFHTVPARSFASLTLQSDERNLLPLFSSKNAVSVNAGWPPLVSFVDLFHQMHKLYKVQVIIGWAGQQCDG